MANLELSMSGQKSRDVRYSAKGSVSKYFVVYGGL